MSSEMTVGETIDAQIDEINGNIKSRSKLRTYTSFWLGLKESQGINIESLATDAQSARMKGITQCMIDGRVSSVHYTGASRKIWYAELAKLWNPVTDDATVMVEGELKTQVDTCESIAKSF